MNKRVGRVVKVKSAKDIWELLDKTGQRFRRRSYLFLKLDVRVEYAKVKLLHVISNWEKSCNSNRGRNDSDECYGHFSK